MLKEGDEVKIVAEKYGGYDGRKATFISYRGKQSCRVKINDNNEEVTIRLSSIIVPQEKKARPSNVTKNNETHQKIEGLARKLDALCKEISEISLALKEIKLGYVD